ncbi:unnamed protein product [Lasius platythorax]|uniref:Uncharacterized protein n=1 Tax=Lasius platythorax TaxID=488582 RepID=A0AAV2NWS4_9HYME
MTYYENSSDPLLQDDRDRGEGYDSSLGTKITSITTHHQCSVDRPTTRVGSISVSACNLPRRMLMDFEGSSPFVSLTRKTPLGTPRPRALGPERTRESRKLPNTKK